MSEVVRYAPGLKDGSELTSLLERKPELEDLCGVKLDALCVVRTAFNAVGHTELDVMGEVHSFLGHVLDRCLTIQIAVYNERGQIVGVAEEYIYEDSYRGYRAIKTRVKCRDEPARIVVYPRW